MRFNLVSSGQPASKKALGTRSQEAGVASGAVVLLKGVFGLPPSTCKTGASGIAAGGDAESSLGWRTRPKFASRDHLGQI